MNSHKLLLALLGVLAIIQFVLAEDQEGFISLDCGLSAIEPSYTESTTGLKFSSDAKFVEGGKSGRIQKDLEANTFKPYATLRYFPSGIQNCYDLNTTQETRYLVRAVFFYGNYDGLDRHPNFDLYIDRNWWETISSRSEEPDKKWASLQSMERRYGTVEEIIHTPRSNTLQVCLVKKDATVPFISALELRPFSNNVYATLNGSLKTFFRLYFRDSVDNIRYPDDVHDRKWHPFLESDLAIIKNSTIKTENTNPYDPPQAAIWTAAIPANASSPLVLSWVTSNPTDQLYIYIHFLELQVLRANDTRIFDIVVNGNITTKAYSPTKSMIDTVYNTVPLSYNNDSECSLELRKTSDSNLPPLINAIEAFTVLVFSERETYENDVIAMEKILAAYALIKGSGDPCLPKPSHYLKCSNYTDTSEPLRIISLDLSSNNLTGGVPKFLSHMNDLLFIDLSNNSLSGPVPQALLDRKKERLVLNLHGNPELYEITSSKKNFPVAVVASVVSIAIVLVVLVFLFIGLRRKQSRSEALRPSIETAKRRFTYSEIMAMTNNFQKILGEGGFGIIYHGHLNNSQQVAVKVLSQSSSQGYKQFKAEVELLMRVHHINLVSLAGYCDERDHLALVYEYMANRDLKEHLSENEAWDQEISQHLLKAVVDNP